MNGDDKVMAIISVAGLVGMVGANIVGWPALVAAAVAIAAIAFAKGEPE